MAACGLETGRVYLWSIITPQRWSALAPDFAEVEENVEYLEHEDEFDIHPIEEIHKRRLDLEDEVVDILTVEPVKGEFDDESFRMPVLLDIDDSESDEEVVAVGPGTMRRKSPGEGREWKVEKDTVETGDEGATPKRSNGQVAAKPHTKSRRR